MGDIDLALRHVATHCPEELVRMLAPPGDRVYDVRFVDTQLALRERRVDKGILAQHDGYRVIYHYEWFVDHADLEWRMFEYACELVAATRNADEALYVAALKASQKNRALAPPQRPDPVYLRACAVLLDGDARPMPEESAWRITPPGMPEKSEGRHTFRIEAVYQQTTAQLLAHPGALWAVFAPLAVDATEENLRLAVQVARERAHSRRQLEGIASAMEAIATARPRFNHVADRIVAMFKDEGIIKQTPSYRMGVQEGIEKGIEKGLRDAIMRVCAARALKVTAAQRTKLAMETRPSVLRAWLARAANAARASEIFAAT
jgi:hypothetical protein